MKQFLYILCLLSLAACSPGGIPQNDAPASPNLVSQQEGDGEEHELIILDPGFQTWKATYARPVSYYSPSYYERWNERYVRSWNEKVDLQPMNGSLDYPFQNRIDYSPMEDYGLELNYELFWYFRYIESLYGDRYNFPN
ncbi:DUF6146 family protein [Nafulsella turpanensis]|uniref:DUF6146 family protein n=1 Tax=Nafulsella turpanensis TaxID=1265690 RepID=UPI00034AA967|nr:DUF6146 family protein [Nafulsella turpanensis]